MRECLALVKFGVPFDVAFSVDPTVRLAWLINFSEMESGQKWDWNALCWREVK